MPNTPWRAATRIRSSLLVASVALAAFWCGLTLEPDFRVRADVRQSTSREQFKSGGARSEIVLREIHATLERMEKRLEHIETIMAEAASQP